MPPRKVQMLVEFDLPEGATEDDARAYVEDAISTWAGSLYPGYIDGEEDPPDPFFDLDRKSIRITDGVEMELARRLADIALQDR